jgi:hypothetical protein
MSHLARIMLSSIPIVAIASGTNAADSRGLPSDAASLPVVKILRNGSAAADAMPATIRSELLSRPLRGANISQDKLPAQARGIIDPACRNLPVAPAGSPKCGLNSIRIIWAGKLLTKYYAYVDQGDNWYYLWVLDCSAVCKGVYHHETRPLHSFADIRAQVVIGAYDVGASEYVGR